MGFDASLVAAATIHRRTLAGEQCGLDDAVHQVSLAHVLLDGGYDGLTTVAEALRGGDHGLGTFDRLDGEMVVVDGEPWQVDWHGHANLMPGDALTPFAVVTDLVDPKVRRTKDVSREWVAGCVEGLVDDPGAVVAVRLEGTFRDVLVRSVPPQEKPYRPYVEVCTTDEVRFEHATFEGVFVGFRFPDLEGGAAIPGLHLHGLDHARTTGGHLYELQVVDAELSVGVTRDVVLSLPDRSMLDLLETDTDVRAVQRALLRLGASSADAVAADLGLSPAAATERLTWLADRGYAELRADADGERWHSTLTARPRVLPQRLLAALDALDRPDA